MYLGPLHLRSVSETFPFAGFGAQSDQGCIVPPMCPSVIQIGSKSSIVKSCEWRLGMRLHVGLGVELDLWQSFLYNLVVCI